MHNVTAIGRREILSFFVSPIAYFVITGFVLLGGYFFFNYLGIFNIILQRYLSMPVNPGMNLPNLNQWVIEGYFQTLLVILVFLIPLLTMRVIAEEKKRGTFELLVTSPVSVFEIVLGKFSGVAFVILVMVLAASAYPLLLCWLGNPEVMPIFSGMLAVLLCALMFASIGMAVSSFTENQIVAGVSSMVTLLLLYVIHSPAEALGGGLLADSLQWLSPIMQARDLINGVITVKSLVYFFSMITLGLFLSQRALEAYRWR
ncbi:MAG: ABC transporter permease subunit [Deltaproteobacteria bacterium]|nr:ABC transporter permease subunit [Deltaproteobacteria bacterium]